MRDGRELKQKIIDNLYCIVSFYKELGVQYLPFDFSELSKLTINHFATEHSVQMVIKSSKSLKPDNKSQNDSQIDKDITLFHKHTLNHQKIANLTIETLQYNDFAKPLQQANMLSTETLTDNVDKQTLLNNLRAKIGDCKRCKLSEGRTNLVFGIGNPNTEIMFIGEGPGKEEDLQGVPFVGEAGQILTNLIFKMGQQYAKDFNAQPFQRDDVYIANVVKCRPPQNRDPELDEIEACLGFLFKQIEIISPKIIVTLGRISTYTLMKSLEPLKTFSISKVRGKFFEFKHEDMILPVMPTFHPAYFLRNPKEKRKTWQDMMMVLQKLNKNN